MNTGIRQVKRWQLVSVLVLACIFWIIIFGLKLINFWLGMAIAASCLAGIGLYLAGPGLRLRDFTWQTWVGGAVSAAILYGIFWLGNIIAAWLFGFAPGQVENIYLIRQEGSPWLISFVLLFITSPAEELFWRGFLQNQLIKLWGISGVVAAILIYGLIHVWSGNLMLTLAALVAGAFWSLLYLLTKNLALCVVSHALWTLSIFILWPMS